MNFESRKAISQINGVSVVVAIIGIRQPWA